MIRARIDSSLFHSAFELGTTILLVTTLLVFLGFPIHTVQSGAARLLSARVMTSLDA